MFTSLSAPGEITFTITTVGGTGQYLFNAANGFPDGLSGIVLSRYFNPATGGVTYTYQNTNKSGNPSDSGSVTGTQLESGISVYSEATAFTINNMSSDCAVTVTLSVWRAR